jgi:hypothetical protein
MNEVIVCAAIRNAVGVVVCGARHYDATMVKLIELLGVEHWSGKSVDQGFLTSQGRFVGREDGLLIARTNSQLKYECGGSDIKLFSEMLY